MKELTDIALDKLNSAGASYGDIRIVTERRNEILVRQRSIKRIEDAETRGYGVRALIDGAWGFASSTDLTREGVASTAATAARVARASAKAPKLRPAEMAREDAHVDTVVTPVGKDPFGIPHNEKAELLLAINDRMLGVEGIALAISSLRFVRLERVVANTDGSYLDMTHTVSQPHVTAVAVVGDDRQDRSFQKGACAAGWEYIEGLNLLDEAPEIARQAVVKAKADETPTGKFDLVLDPMHLCLTMHESVGHPTELDRILGWEANMAGRSFIEPGMIGSLQYGSELVSLTADNTLEGGLATWGYDDDGVPGRKWPIVKQGVLAGVTTVRETAPLVGQQRSCGSCRADSFSSFPITRIPNLYMEPGETDLTAEDIIADTERGIYVQGRGSFSIDQQRTNFQFGGDFFQLIENGELTGPLKKVTYQSKTTDFWKSCDAVAGRADWRAYGLTNCGKGEPMQTMMMTHGASTCRFRNIEVGASRE